MVATGPRGENLFVKQQPIEEIARANAALLPGPAEAFSLFERSLRVLDDASAPSTERRTNFIRAISAIELIQDPSVSGHKSLQAIDAVDKNLHERLTTTGGMFPGGKDHAGELEFWANAITDNYALLNSVLHSRSALAAGAAELARRIGYVAQGLLPDPNSESPIVLRLIKPNSAFMATFSKDHLEVSEVQEIRPEVLPIAPHDWLGKIISEHRMMFTTPDKQAALVRLELMLSPSDFRLQSDLITSLYQSGRPDAAIETANAYILAYRGLD